MVTARLFVEGGGNTRCQQQEARRTVAERWDRTGMKGPRPAVVACRDGSDASRDHSKALAQSPDSAPVLLGEGQGSVAEHDAWSRVLWNRESLKRDVLALAAETSEEGWDDEGALALSSETVAIASDLADLIPLNAPKPDVDATPHGEIDFDWTIEPGLGVTISVGPEGDIAFAGTFRGAELSGKEPWTGALPGFVECCLDRLQREAK